MYLIYLDESGNSGGNLNDPQQPVFVLGALLVPEGKWQAVEQGLVAEIKSFFGGAVPEKFEVHATDIRNNTGHFRGVPVSERVKFSDSLLQVAVEHGLKLVYRAITKKRYSAWLEREFGAGVIINPHIAAYPLIVQAINNYLRSLGDDVLGILINDEQKEVVADIERTTRLLRADPGRLQLDRIIEKGFFIDSSKSHLLQLADLCIFHARKLEEIKLGLPPKRIDASCIKLIEPLVHRGSESMSDVLSWLATQNKRSGEGSSGTGSPRGGRSRR
jgi:hypothetical protein